MKNTTVRLPEYLWERIEHEASLLGQSGSAFIRDSVLLRIGYRAGLRGEFKDLEEAFDRIVHGRQQP